MDCRVCSLFSGAGGIDLGFRLAGGFRPVLANDILSPPAQTYARNFGHKIVDVSQMPPELDCPVYLLGDVSEVDFSKVDLGSPAVVVGGPPCQDFSIVRGPEKERKGIEVKRGKLYSHFIRALIHLQPEVFVFENVPGLKSANKGTAYKTIIEDFSNLNLKWPEIKKIVGNNFGSRVKGYTILFSDVVDSADIGVPQRRKRLIVIGVRSDLLDWTAENELRQKAEATLSGRGSLFRKYPLTPLEVFEGLPLPELDQSYSEIMMDYRDVAESVASERAAEWRRSVWKSTRFDVLEDYFHLNGITPKSGEIERMTEEHTAVLKKLGYYKKRLEGCPFPDNSNTVAPETRDVAERMMMIPPGENHMFVRGTKWEVEGRGMSLIYRRIHPLRPSYTIVAYGGGGTWGYHYRRSRCKLTNRERARLQTFPDSFLFCGSSAEVRAQIGEAVPPLLGEKIAEVVSMILSAAGAG